VPPADNGDDEPTPDGSITVCCSLCARTGDGPPMTWMRQTDPGRGSVWVCAECSRIHLRAIEAKLDQSFW
jgi:hypothetical protein